MATVDFSGRPSAQGTERASKQRLHGLQTVTERLDLERQRAGSRERPAQETLSTIELVNALQELERQRAGQVEVVTAGLSAMLFGAFLAIVATHQLHILGILGLLLSVGAVCYHWGRYENRSWRFQAAIRESYELLRQGRHIYVEGGTAKRTIYLASPDLEESAKAAYRGLLFFLVIYSVALVLMPVAIDVGIAVSSWAASFVLLLFYRFRLETNLPVGNQKYVAMALITYFFIGLVSILRPLLT